MTEIPTAPTIPAGWYPNPENPAQHRWWDGAQWTDHVSAPAYTPASTVAQLRAPAGTNVNTIWIWIAVFVPLLRLVPWFTWDISPLGEVSGPIDSRSLLETQLAVYTQPAFLGSLTVTVLIAAAAIIFAALDWRTLRRRGVPSPFHWGFAFTALITIFCVYPVGRAVVTKRRTGRRSNVLVFAIVVQVALLAVPISNLSQLSRVMLG